MLEGAKGEGDPVGVDQYSHGEPPLGRGGMAVVYLATDPSGVQRALKRPLPFPNCSERLEREVSALSAVDHPHVMPLLDSGHDDSGDPWYVMPVAEGSLRQLWEDGAVAASADELAEQLLEDVGHGLAAMHDAGFVHRDVTPNNILAIADEERPRGLRWVIADCGLVRRPLGETTQGLTGSVSQLGTAGYMAPESFGDPHHVTAAADVYSLGRVLAWLLTGRRPHMTAPLLPEGPWRGAIRLLTRENPEQRPGSMQEALERVAPLLDALPTSPRAELRAQISERGGELSPVNPLWQVVEDHLEDYEFMIDDLPTITPTAARRLAEKDAERAARIAQRLAEQLVSGDYGSRSYDRLNTHLGWVLAVLQGLEQARRADLLEDVAAAHLEAVRTWDRYRHNDELSRWVTRLRDPSASAFARAVRASGTQEYLRGSMSGRFSSATLEALLG